MVGEGERGVCLGVLPHTPPAEAFLGRAYSRQPPGQHFVLCGRKGHVEPVPAIIGSVALAANTSRAMSLHPNSGYVYCTVTLRYVRGLWATVPSPWCASDGDLRKCDVLCATAIEMSVMSRFVSRGLRSTSGRRVMAW